MSPIGTHALDACTVEFGPDFPPGPEARAAWSAVSTAFLLDRFGSTGAWIAADWERVLGWPCDIDPPGAYVLDIDASEVRVARRARFDVALARALVTSPGYQWDGLLLIAGSAERTEIESYVRTWFASMNKPENALRAPCDAAYPVVDGFGLRYTNATRTAAALALDVERIVAQTLP